MKVYIDFSKRLVRLGMLCLLLFAGLNEAQAQRFRITYVAPTDSMLLAFDESEVYSKWYTEQNDDGTRDTLTIMPGYRFLTMNAAREAGFRSIAPPNIRRTYDSLATGTLLRTRVDTIMQLTGGVVDVDLFLVDDRAGIVEDEWFFSTPIDGDAEDGSRYIWPAAWVWKCGDRFCGRVGLGDKASAEIQAWEGGWLAWEGTVLHEVSHTQFLPDPVKRFNKWGDIGIAYGGDDGHWVSELQGDQQIPLDEGFASFWGAMHNPGEEAELVKFFNKTEPRYRLGSWSFLTGTKEMWDAPHEVLFSGDPADVGSSGYSIQLDDDMVERAQGGGRYELRAYKWLDVPGKYILYNEHTSTAFFYFFWKYATIDPDYSYRMAVACAADMAGADKLRKRYLGYAVNRLALSMEDYVNTPQGKIDREAGSLVSSMFPFALLDILTHFGMTEEEYKREYSVRYPDRHPKAFEAYWEHRQEIKNAMVPHIAFRRIDIEGAIEAAEEYLKQPDTILVQ